MLTTASTSSALLLFVCTNRGQSPPVMTHSLPYATTLFCMTVDADEVTVLLAVWKYPIHPLSPFPLLPSAPPQAARKSPLTATPDVQRFVEEGDLRWGSMETFSMRAAFLTSQKSTDPSSPPQTSVPVEGEYVTACMYPSVFLAVRFSLSWPVVRSWR